MTCLLNMLFYASLVAPMALLQWP